MDDVQTTFQSRLSSRLNRLSQKLNDNAIRLSGTISDCIKISLKTSPTGDIISRKDRYTGQATGAKFGILYDKQTGILTETPLIEELEPL